MDEQNLNNGVPDFIAIGNRKVAQKKAQQQLIDEQNLTPLQKLKKNRTDAIKKKNAQDAWDGKDVNFKVATYGAGKEAEESYINQQRMEKSAPYMSRDVNQDYGSYDENGNDTGAGSAFDGTFADEVATSFKRGVGKTLLGSNGDLINMVFSGIGATANQLLNFNDEKISFDADFGRLYGESNALTDFLKEQGQQMENDNQSYLPEELKNPELSFSTFFNPKFWSYHGGEFLPQLAEVALSYGAGSLAKKGVQGAMKAGFKDLLDEGAKKAVIREGAEIVSEKSAKQLGKEIAEESVQRGLVNQAKRKSIFGEVRQATNEIFDKAAAKAGKINELKNTGSGILGKTLTSKGTLTKSFGDMVQATGAGLYTNLSVGLKNGGELYNTYKGMVKTDSEGNPIMGEDGKPIPLFSDEELGQMARDSFVNNMSYLGMDILSWGLTYGKGMDMLKGIPKNILGKGITAEAGEAIGKKALDAAVKGTANEAGKSFRKEMVSRLIKPVLQKSGALAGKMAFEGAEESVQETFEEWSKMKAYAEVNGSLKGYQGLRKDRSEYDTKSGVGILSGGFWDYYTDKDSEGIRTISAALGAVAGGAFNFRAVMNREAEAIRKTGERFDMIDKIHNTNEGKALQQTEIYRQMAELVNENKGQFFAEMIEGLHNDGKITDAEFKRFGATYDQIAANQEAIDALKLSGKKAFMRSVADEVHFTDKLVEAEEEYQKNKEVIVSAFEGYMNDAQSPEARKSVVLDQERKINDLDKDYNNKVLPLKRMILIEKERQRRILTGKEAPDQEAKITEQPDGELKYEVGPAKKIYDAEFMTDEEIENNERWAPQSKMIEGQKQIGTTAVGQEIGKPSDNLNMQAAVEGKAIKQLGQTVEEQTSETGQVNPIQPDSSEKTFSDIENEIDSEVKPEDLKTADEIQKTEEKVEPKKTPPLKSQVDKTIYAQNVSEKLIIDEALTEEEQAFYDQNKDFVENEKANIEKYWDDVFAKDESDPEIRKEATIYKIQADREERNPTKKQPKNESSSEEKITVDEIEDDIFNEDSRFSRESKGKFDKDDIFNRVSEIFQKAKSVLNNVDKKEISEKISNLFESAKTSAKNFNKKEFLAEVNKIFESAKTKVSETDRESILNDLSDFYDTAKTKIKDAQQELNRNKNKQKLMGKISDVLKSKKTKLKEKSAAAKAFMEDDFGTEDFVSLAQSIQVSNALSKLYPDSDINVYAVKDMKRVFGEKALGLALAGQIYIDEQNWGKGNTLYHEVSHIYYQLTKNDPNTQALVKSILLNKKLAERILRDYDDFIQFRDKTTGEVLFKREIIGRNYDKVSQQVRDQTIFRKIEKGEIEVIPLSQQEVIIEEMFTTTLEGRLSDTYNMYFEQYPRKVQEDRLKMNWWRSIRNRAKKMELDERNQFFLSLKPKDAAEWTDNLNTIMKAFSKETKGTRLSSDIRFSRAQQLDQEQESRWYDILTSLESERKDFINQELMVQRMKTETAEDLMNDIDFETIFDETDRLGYTNKLMNVILDFSRKYNKSVSLSNLYSKSKQRWKNDEYNSAERLRYYLTLTAGVSENSIDFIDRLNNSDRIEVKRFMKYLDNSKRGDKNLMLQTLWWHENNISNINSFKIFVNGNQDTSIENNLNNTEKTTLENAVYDWFKVFNSTERHYNDNYQNTYDSLMNAAQNIYNNNYTKSDINAVINFFIGKPGFDTEMIIGGNRINYNGKVQPLDSVIVKFVKDKNGFLGNKSGSDFITSASGVPVFGIYNKDGKLKSGFRNLMRSLINENRQYTSKFTVQHADGNMHQSRIVDNYLSRGIKQMKKDALDMGINKFLSKYSVLNQNQKGALSNNFLKFFHNKMNTVGDIDLMEYGGIQNSYNDDKDATMKSSDIVTERLGQFMAFLNTASASSYIMDLGRFSDSSRAFYMESPRVDTDSVVSVSNGKVSIKDSALLNNIYNTHVSLGYKGNLSDFKESILTSIKDQIDFLNSNLSGIQNDSKMANKITDGKLNAKGQMFVANYEINQIINGTNFTEIFFPSFKIQNEKGENMLIKRAKNASSPMFAFKENVKIEPIFVEDIKLNIPGNSDFDATDAGFYILEEDAEKFRSAGGTIMPLGNAFKLLHTGIERTNKNMMNKNIYNKGYATVINEAEVKQNPELKGVFELLKARKAQYEDKFGKTSKNLLDGTHNHITMVVPQSANKSENNLPGFYNLDVMNYQSLTDMANAKDLSQAMNILDQLNYDGDSFIGMDGSNFGIQQVMDIDKDYANMSVQFIKSLTTNMMFHEDNDLVNSVLQDIKELSESQIDDAYKMLMNNDPQEIRDFFRNMVDTSRMDQKQRAVIFDDGVSLTTPYAREIVKNTLANYIKQNGLKLKTPGNILREKPSLYRKPNGWKTSSDMNATTGFEGLNFYQKNENGTNSKGEAIVPESMIDFGNIDSKGKKNKITPRKYFVDPGLNLENNLILARQFAKGNRKIGKVFDKNDNHIGYYTEGDTIMATRIPSHGVQSTGVFEVVDYSRESGNNIQLPHEFKNIVGSDNDGDQIFVQHKGNSTYGWNKILDKIEKHYLSNEMWDEIHTPIDFKEDVKEALKAIKAIYGETKKDFILPFSSKGRQQAFKDTMIAKANVGTAANFHSTLRMFANYNVGVNTPIIIDDVYADQFTDSESESASIKSAKVFNIILDNSKSGNADKLNINSNTIAMTMILSNLNFSLDKIAVILNHPMIKAYGELKDNNVNIFNKDEKLKIMDKLKEDFGLPMQNKSFSSIQLNTSNLSNQEVFNFISLINGMESEISDVTSVLSIHNTMTVNPFEIKEIVNKFDHRMNVENGRTEYVDGKIVKEKSNLNFKKATGKNDFAENPIVQNYRNVLLKNLDIQKKIDPVYSGQLDDLYKEVLSLSTKEFSKENHKSLLNAIELFHTSQILNVNSSFEKQFFENLVADYAGDPSLKNYNPDNIFNKMEAHIYKMKTTPVYVDPDNALNNVSQYQDSVLFNKGINISLTGRKFISINNEFHENMMDSEVRNAMLEEWKNLPRDLKRDLMMYDLMKTGWTGNLSLFPLFEAGFKMVISNNSAFRTNNTENELNLLKNAIIKNNHQLFRKYDNVMVYNENAFDITRELNPAISTNNRDFNYLLMKGKPFVFKTQNQNGKTTLVKFNGFSAEEIMEAQIKMRDDSSYYVNEFLPLAMSKMSKNIPIKNNPNKNVDYITISDKKTPRKSAEVKNERTSTFEEALKNVPENGNIFDDLGMFKDSRFQRVDQMMMDKLDFFQQQRENNPYEKISTNRNKRAGDNLLKDIEFKKMPFKKLVSKLNKGIFHDSFLKFQKYVPRDITYGQSSENAVEKGINLFNGVYVPTNKNGKVISIAAMNPFKYHANVIDPNGISETVLETTDTLFHEQVHAVLFDSLNDSSKNFDQKFYNEMFDLYETASKKVREFFKANPNDEFFSETGNIYGLKNIQEFAAESMSNPNFVKFLSRIPSQKNVKNNLFQDILKTVENFFNIKIGKSLATDVISLIGQKIDSMPTYDQKKQGIHNVLTQPSITEDFENDTLSMFRNMRFQRRDYYNFSEKMNRDTFEFVMEFPHEFDENKRQLFYQNYQEEWNRANALKEKINADTVKNMTDEQLISLYEAEEIDSDFGGGLGIGRRSKFAYAQILNPIIKELANRGATEQSKLTGREYDGNDISVIKKFFMANNVPSNHPAAQFIVRRMETEYKTFLDERQKVVSKINKATDELYQEQLNYSPSKGTFRDTIQSIKTALFSNKEELYTKLYGNLIEYQESTQEDGSKRVDMKYKPKAQIDKEFKEGIISPAQYNFYNVTREVSEEMKKYHLKEGEGRMDYIPHSAPANFEILSRRGFLGLMINAKTIDEKLGDVKMSFVHPVTGQKIDNVSYKAIKDVFNTISKDPKYRNAKNSVDFIRLKKKAITLNRKGINEDGTAIRQSEVEIGTAIGDTFMHSFSNGRSINSTDLPTLDLNKAFTDYAHATLFQFGNDKFAGFRKMVPIVDGVIALGSERGDKNMTEYVDKIWKQYFLSGQKQNLAAKYTPAYLEAVGLTTDKVIDFITKGSLVYWLGWKGLALGGGMYAIGNVLVGKFQNIVQEGGSAWIEGEKRFWFGKDGKFSVTDPFKGVRESMDILKKIGFMEVNIYDDVNIENKNSIEKLFMNLALLPMARSEKWIQGVQFLGSLKPEEWEHIKNGGEVEKQWLTEKEDMIKQAHGRGYTPTDQRMIQMYSWGRAMMQFNRYIPTMFNTMFGKEDVDIYGKKTIGTYTAVYKTIQKGVTGEWSPMQFSKYFDSLNDEEKKKFKTGLMSLGAISALAAVNTFANSDSINKLISDSHMVLDTDRLAGRFVPRSYLAMEDIFK